MCCSFQALFAISCPGTANPEPQLSGLDWLLPNPCWVFGCFPFGANDNDVWMFEDLHFTSFAGQALIFSSDIGFEGLRITTECELFG